MTRTVSFELLVLKALGFGKLFLLVSDHLVVQRDLVTVELDLLERIHIALIHGLLLFNNAGLVGLKLFNDSLLFLTLCLDRVALGFERVYFGLCDRIGADRRRINNGGSHEHYAKRQCYQA